MILILLIGFVLFGLFGWFLFTWLFDLITGYKKGDNGFEDKYTYIDKSVHYHQHLTIIKEPGAVEETRSIHASDSR